MPDHGRLRLGRRNVRLMRGDLQPVSVPSHSFWPGMIALRRVVLLIQPIYQCLTGRRSNVTFVRGVLRGHQTLLFQMQQDLTGSFETLSGPSNHTPTATTDSVSSFAASSLFSACM